MAEERRPCNLLGITGKARSGKDTVAEMINEELNGVYERYSFANPLKKTVNDMFDWDERHGWGELKEEVVFVSTTGKALVDAVEDNLGEYLRSVGEPGDNAVFVAVIWATLLAAKGCCTVSDTGPQFNSDGTILNITIMPRQAYQWFGTEIGRERIAADIWIQLAKMTLVKTENRPDRIGMIVPDVRFDNEVDFIHSPSIDGVLIHVKNSRVDSGVVHGHVSENGVDISDGDVIIRNNGTLEELREAVKEVVEKKILNADNTKSLTVGV